MLTVFNLLTGESMSEVLFSAMSVMDTIYGSIFAAVFILSWFIFSRLIVSNLFVAVIIENFEVSETIEDIRQPGYLAAFRRLYRYAGLRLYVVQCNLRGKQVKLDREGRLVYKMAISTTLTQAANENSQNQNQNIRKGGLFHSRFGKQRPKILSSDGKEPPDERTTSNSVNQNQFDSEWTTHTHGASFGLPFYKGKGQVILALFTV
jgi:hypothetical protein